MSMGEFPRLAVYSQDYIMQMAPFRWRHADKKKSSIQWRLVN